MQKENNLKKNYSKKQVGNRMALGEQDKNITFRNPYNKNDKKSDLNEKQILLFDQENKINSDLPIKKTEIDRIDLLMKNKEKKDLFKTVLTLPKNKNNDINDQISFDNFNSIDNKNIVKIGKDFVFNKKGKFTNDKLNTILISERDFEKCELEKEDNPQYLVCYTKEIFEYLRNNEHINSAVIGCFTNFQTDITEKMRAVLVDWIIDVHLKFKLLPETLFLTINLVDRFISKSKIDAHKFQLLGISSMLISSKYEEIYAPETRDFVFITGKTFSKEDILKMESKILNVLNFEILTVSPYIFLERFHFISNDNHKKSFHLAQYLIELTLYEYKMLSYKSSIKAATALYLSRKLLKIETPWPGIMKSTTGYSEKDLVACAKDMCIILEIVPKITLKACFKKFCSPNFNEVANVVFKTSNIK